MIYLCAFQSLLLAAVVVGFGVYVVISNRDHQRTEFDHQERFNASQERHNAIVQALAEQAEVEREADRAALRDVLSAARKEREVLMDRIQRPESLGAPVAFAEEPSETPLTVSPDDDEAQWAVLAESA